MTVADFLVSRLQEAGTRAIFGMPGGGSNLDVIDAARRAGLRFVLAHTETAAALMAAAQAEITGAPGACLCTIGPGVSAIVNGVAHASLDRVPLVVLTDAMEPEAHRHCEHQRLAHGALLAPVTKWSAELTASRAPEVIEAAIADACGDRPGPVHLDCAASTMSAEVATADLVRAVEARITKTAAALELDPRAPVPERVARRLHEAKRPVLVAGLDARAPDTAAALRTLCDRHGLPVFTTYKAKGVIPDDHPSYAGLFTLGEIERRFIERADLVITAGLDAVELLPRPWPYTTPLVHCARRGPGAQLPAGEQVPGTLADALAAITASLGEDVHWSAAEIAAHRERQRAAVMAPGEDLSPGEAIAVVAGATSGARHVTVDAGAHMFPAMALMPADRPARILISNGLSTMGYALPAAIGAALLAPDEPVVAITGDAGLLMCLGELRTAARERLRLVVVVMADDELSLIRIKQDRRGLSPEGVRIGEMDWPAVARGMGWRGSRALDGARLRQEVAEAMHASGPSLIEARVDPSGYGTVLRSIRG